MTVITKNFEQFWLESGLPLDKAQLRFREMQMEDEDTYDLSERSDDYLRDIGD